MKTKRKKRRINTTRVGDPGALKRALDDLVRERFHGRADHAALRIGISEPVLSRLRNGRHQVISKRTLDRLLALPGDAIRSAIYPTEVTLRLSQYHRWLKQQMEATTATPQANGKDIESATILDSVRDLEHRLDRPEFLNGRFARMRSRAKNLRASSVRVDLAIARILAPLLQRRSSGCVELSWQELAGRGTRDLRRFVDNGVARELILLGRSPDEMRARKGC